MQLHIAKAFQFYKVEVFNNELTKNLNKVARPTNKDITQNLELYEGLKSGTIYIQMKEFPSYTSK